MVESDDGESTGHRLGYDGAGLSVQGGVQKQIARGVTHGQVVCYSLAREYRLRPPCLQALAPGPVSEDHQTRCRLPRQQMLECLPCRCVVFTLGHTTRVQNRDSVIVQSPLCTQRVAALSR